MRTPSRIRRFVHVFVPIDVPIFEFIFHQNLKKTVPTAQNRRLVHVLVPILGFVLYQRVEQIRQRFMAAQHRQLFRQANE